MQLKKNIQLQLIANDLRKDVVTMLAESASGHTGGSLGTADIFAALYFYPIVRYRAKQIHWTDRDRFVLSNGHICPILYATLARAGFFSKKHLRHLRKIGSILQGHPNRLDTPGIETSTGPLGQGVSTAVGMAIAAKMDRLKHHVYAMVGDGEMQEGVVWEAFMLAATRKLNNFTVIVDRNKLQIDGKTEEINALDPLTDKMRSFGFSVFEIDGHSIPKVVEALEKARRAKGRPTAIIANTIMGKGVSFMENDAHWHGTAPNEQQLAGALRELDEKAEQLKSK